MSKFKFLLPLSLLAMTTYADKVSTLSPLPNAGSRLLSQSQLMEPVSKDTELLLHIWLKFRHPKELDQLVQEVYDPNSSHYQQFLTTPLYEERFAPSQNAVNKVQHFFLEQGMRADVVNHHLRVLGSVAQIERALHLKINYYRYQNALFYANAQAPKLPSDLAHYVTEITGLNTLPEWQESALVPQEISHAPPKNLAFIWQHVIPEAHPTSISLQGFSGANLQKTYNLKQIPKINGVPLNGAGQTLVIVDKCGTNGPSQILSDANQYFNMNNITPFITKGPLKNFAIINPDGTPFTSCPNASSFSREIVLDIEASHTIAPGNNTALVLGTNQRTTLMEVIDTLIHNHFTIAGFSNAYVISNSWSSQETDDAVLESSLKLAAAAGISVNFSSGDCGDNTYTNAGKCNGSWPSAPTVNYPSSSAYVTAVGATALFVDNLYRYAFETVWGTVASVNGVLSFTGGTGGGISQYYGPVSWQKSIKNFTAGGYGVISDQGNHRALPDIAMLGDPRTGLLIIANGSQVQDGGTSLACPLFSATLLLVNQARALLNKGTPIGQAAVYLYRKNKLLSEKKALRLIIPPSTIISGSTPPPTTWIHNTPAPASSFTIGEVTFGWDSSLTIEPENQFWNDAVGVGSPNIPNFVMAMADM